MDPEIDLLADLNAEDDEGLGWSATSDARDSSQVRPGVMLVAGNRHGKAVVLTRCGMSGSGSTRPGPGSGPGRIVVRMVGVDGAQGFEGVLDGAAPG